MPPGPNTTKGAGKPPKPLLQPHLDIPLPSPHVRNKLAPPWGVSKHRNLLFVFDPPNFLSGLRSISIDEEAKNSGG